MIRRFICVGFALLVGILSAQTASNSLFIGGGIETYYSINGHGAFYVPHMSLNKKRHHFKLGPCIQKRKLQLNGLKLSYSYMLAGRDAEEQLNATFKDNSNGSWRVSLYSYLQYVDLAALSFRRTEEETLINGDSLIDWNNVRLSTGELGVGVELDIKVFKYLQLRTYAGISAYTHFNSPSMMYQDKTAATFIAGVGMNVPSFRKY